MQIWQHNVHYINLIAMKDVIILKKPEKRRIVDKKKCRKNCVSKSSKNLKSNES